MNINEIKKAFQYAKRVADQMVGGEFSFNSSFFANANSVIRGELTIFGYNDRTCQVSYGGVAFSVLYDWTRGFIINPLTSLI
jgi:hypothetical protein